MIEVDDRTLALAGRSFPYSAYYLDFKDVPNLTSRTSLKIVLADWMTALIESLGTDRVLFLPYSLEDEWVECFKATLSGEMVSLTEVYVNENGWAVNILDLTGFILSPHSILKESSTPFATVPVQDLIDSLNVAITAT